MLQIEGIKLALDQDEGLLRRKAAAELGVPEAALRDFRIFRRAVDAREGVRFVYTLRVSVQDEGRVLRRCKSRGVSPVEETI